MTEAHCTHGLAVLVDYCHLGMHFQSCQHRLFQTWQHNSSFFLEECNLVTLIHLLKKAKMQNIFYTKHRQYFLGEKCVTITCGSDPRGAERIGI